MAEDQLQPLSITQHERQSPWQFLSECDTGLLRRTPELRQRALHYFDDRHRSQRQRLLWHGLQHRQVMDQASQSGGAFADDLQRRPLAIEDTAQVPFQQQLDVSLDQAERCTQFVAHVLHQFGAQAVDLLQFTIGPREFSRLSLEPLVQPGALQRHAQLPGDGGEEAQFVLPEDSRPGALRVQHRDDVVADPHWHGQHGTDLRGLFKVGRFLRGVLHQHRLTGAIGLSDQAAFDGDPESALHHKTDQRWLRHQRAILLVRQQEAEACNAQRPV